MHHSSDSIPLPKLDHSTYLHLCVMTFLYSFTVNPPLINHLTAFYSGVPLLTFSSVLTFASKGIARAFSLLQWWTSKA
jgi:hypothetical protein